MQKSCFFNHCTFVGAIMAFLFIDAANEHRLIIDIPSYNNKEWYVKNLDSVLNQIGHSNYLAVITDDCSPDGTGDLLEKYIASLSQEKRDHVKLIKNKERRGALANHYHVIQMASDNDIIVQLDGDDFFKTTDVFTYINDLYKNGDIWWTYGVYENWPDETTVKCFSRELTEEDGVNRTTVPFVFGPIRSYRAWFAKQIKLQDLIADFEPCRGKFYGSAGDFALIYPLLEMSHVGHFQFIDKIMYTRNVATPINDFKVNKNLQEQCARAIKAIEPYNPLYVPGVFEHKSISASVFIFDMDKNVEHLKNCIESVKTHVEHYKKITIIYNNQGLACSPEYQALKESHKDCMWVDFSKVPKYMGIKYALRASFADYVFLIHASALVQKKIDLTAYALLLRKTKAYSFLFGSYPSKLLPHEWFDNDIFIWKYSLTQDIAPVHTLQGGLYRYGDVMTYIKKMKYASVDEFINQWTRVNVDAKKVGFYVDPACVVMS